MYANACLHVSYGRRVQKKEDTDIKQYVRSCTHTSELHAQKKATAATALMSSATEQLSQCNGRYVQQIL